MKAYLINMQKDTDRLEHMAGQFERLGVDWELIPAVNMLIRSEAELAAFRLARRDTFQPYNWTPGQIGNLSSQMAVWRRIGEGDEPWGMVFEDDVHIDPRAKPLFADGSWIPSGADIVRFETTRQGMRLGSTIEAAIPSPFQVRRLKAEAWGTAAYAIHRDVARWLALTPARLQAPTDWLLFHTRTTIAACLNTLQLIPAPCIQDQFLLASEPRNGFPSATDVAVQGGPDLLTRVRPYVARFGRRLLGKQAVEFSNTKRWAQR